MLELLLAISIVLGIISYIYVNGNVLQDSYKRNQVRLVASTLAMDLRQLQQKTMFRCDRRILYLSAFDGEYRFYMDSVYDRKVTFASLGCPKVYFEQSIPKVSFNEYSVPIVNGSYILRHRDLKKYSCVVTLQPVTGRVSIYEAK